MGKEKFEEQESFWNRLLSFVSNVETGCCMGEEEKQMIISVCNTKLEDFKSQNIDYNK
jgi:hypothetical protein